MKLAPTPKDEEARLKSLHELQILDNPKLHMFEGAADIAAEMFGSSIGLVSLIDTNRQWFAEKYNFEENEAARDVSFCGHVIMERSVMVIPDARLDSRFRDNPNVIAGTKPVVFYAGAPLVTPDNHALGTLCVIDHEPRYPNERQIRSLEHLARFVVDQMELRRSMLRHQHASIDTARAHREQVRRLNDVAQDLRTALSGMVGLADSLSQKITDPQCEQSLSTLKYSAMSLVQITEHLSADTLLQLKGTNLTLSHVNPLAIAAAALSSFNAEAERRHLETGIESDRGANVSLFTDQERLRLLLFHAVGFLMAQVEDGELRVRMKAGERDNTVVFALTAAGKLESHATPELWKQALGNQIDVADLPGTQSLFSVRDLCCDLGGSTRIQQGEAELILSLQLPVAAKGNRTPQATF